MNYVVRDSRTGKELTAATLGVAMAYALYMNSLVGFEAFTVIES